MSATALGGHRTYQVSQTRIIPPHSGPQLVQRDRLIGGLERGARLPLTVVTGPPGSGKTSLLSSWVRSRACASPPAWLSLEREDRDGARFWSAAIEAIEATGNVALARDLRGLGGDRADFLAAFGNLLDAVPTPLRLVLDDFHELQGSAVAAELDALLRHPPRGLRLIIASRADPVLSLHRLRMSAHLAELRGAELAFTEPEAGELFSQAGVELGAAEVRALVRKTEGWAGGLRLAALSLADTRGAAEFIRNFTGDDRTVAEYLVEQALDSQPAEIRDFMLRTSIVDAVTSDLADELTGNSDGARILEQLVRGNVFITGHSQPHGWFRYHRMFGELLRAQLRHRAPHLVALEHRRASHWYARNDLNALAARHALAADDAELAASAVCRGWLKLLLEGHPGTVTPSIARLPEAIIARNPELAMAAAALLFQSGRPQEARGFMALGDRGASNVDPHRRRHWLLSRTVAQIYADRSIGDFAAVAIGAGRLLSGLGSDISELSSPDRRAFALVQLGVAQTWLGEHAQALGSLEDALALALHASRSYLACNALGALAVHHARQGELRRARQVADEALALGERHGWSDRPEIHGARLALATCAYHQGRGHEARRQLDVLAGATSLEPPLAVGCRVLHARLALRDGELELARIALASLRRDAHTDIDCDGPDRAAWFAGAAEAEAEVLCGLGAGDQALTALGTDSDSPKLRAEIVRARLALADAEPERVTAAAAARSALVGSGHRGSTSAAVELIALTAVAHHQNGSDDDALACAEQALDLAEPDGYVDPFLAVGRPMRELLGRRIRAGTAHRALAGAIVELLDPRPTPPGRESRTLLLEPLSERELTVLRYLPTPLSKAEIASEMFVTVNTVKTHVKSIYRKLDVGNRLEAVKRARALALI